jgi:hypothetical protein
MTFPNYCPPLLHGDLLPDLALLLAPHRVRQRRRRKLVARRAAPGQRSLPMMLLDKE